MKQFNLEEYLRNPSRKVVTRDGRNVRILCTDAKGNHPVIGLVDYKDYEDSYGYTNNGRIMDDNYDGNLDIFFAPEKHERWVNLYKEDNNIYTSMGTFKTKEEAEALRCSSCIATVKVEWEE